MLEEVVTSGPPNPCPLKKKYTHNLKPESYVLFGFPDSSVGEESPCSAGDPNLIPGSGRSAGERIGYPLQYSWASLVSQLVKHPPAILGGEDPLRREKLSTPVFWPGEFHGLHSPWG